MNITINNNKLFSLIMREKEWGILGQLNKGILNSE